jgi:hypothetical protein
MYPAAEYFAAGQEVYYATHSFFLSSRALCISLLSFPLSFLPCVRYFWRLICADLIVFNLLRDETTNRIEYWLQSVSSRAGNAPVVLVGTFPRQISLCVCVYACMHMQLYL